MAQEPTDVPVIADWTKLLEGKVAVVTGGGDGIGGAISRLFAEHGAKVEIAEIDPERAERKQAEIDDAGGSACAHVVDVRVDDEVAGFAETVVAEHGASTCWSTTSATTGRSCGSRRRHRSRGTRCTRSTCATSSR